MAERVTSLSRTGLWATFIRGGRPIDQHLDVESRG